MQCVTIREKFGLIAKVPRKHGNSYCHQGSLITLLSEFELQNRGAAEIIIKWRVKNAWGWLLTKSIFLGLEKIELTRDTSHQETQKERKIDRNNTKDTSPDPKPAETWPCPLLCLQDRWAGTAGRAIHSQSQARTIPSLLCKTKNSLQHYF